MTRLWGDTGHLQSPPSHPTLPLGSRANGGSGEPAVFAAVGPAAPRHPRVWVPRRRWPPHPSRGSHSSPFLASGNSSLPFLLFRKQQQQSQTPVLGDSAASIPQEWQRAEKALSSTPPTPLPRQANHNCAAPAHPPSPLAGGLAGWRSLGKLPGGAEEPADLAPGPWQGPGLQRLSLPVGTS